MRFFYYLVALALPLGGLSAAETKVNFDLDESQWELAYEGGVDNFTIVEYVPKGESLESWTELISVVSYDGISESPDKVYHSMIEELKSRCPNSTVESNIIESQDDSLVAVWTQKEDRMADENNWVKIIAQNNELHTLLVTSKQRKGSGPESQVWEKMLKNAKLVSK